MPIDTLLSRLDKAKPKGKGQWIACCPAHEDRAPSMTIAETDDGRVLIHCFAGCSVEEILSAVGLGFDVLFPPKPDSHNPKHGIAKPYLPSAVLEVLAFEALVVAAAARQLANGESLDSEDYQRLLLGTHSRPSVATHGKTRGMASVSCATKSFTRWARRLG